VNKDRLLSHIASNGAEYVILERQNKSKDFTLIGSLLPVSNKLSFEKHNHAPQIEPNNQGTNLNRNFNSPITTVSFEHNK